MKFIIFIIAYLCFGFSYFTLIGAIISSLNNNEKQKDECLNLTIILYIVIGICYFILEKM